MKDDEVDNGGSFHGISRLAAYVLSRGIGWQGVGIFINGILGAAAGPTVSVFSTFMAFSVSEYIREFTVSAGHGPVHTGSHWVNDILNVYPATRARKQAQSILEPFRRVSTTECIQKIVDDMVQEMHTGLAIEGRTFVPTGVLRVQLGGKDRIVKQEQLEVSIPPSGSNEELSASGLAAFVADEGEGFQLLPGQKRVLGFTFSFPGIDAGTLLKGFAVGRDVVEAAMHRNGVERTVAALVNDTEGTLAGACYVESIPKWQGPYPNSGCTGNFAPAPPSLPMTEVDDLESEQMLSGMYLGDIVRRVPCKPAEQAEFSGDKSYPLLLIPFVSRTPDVSAMHADTSPDLKEVTRVLKTVFGIKSSTLAMRKMIVDICDAVAERGARLSAAGVVAILQKIGRTNIRSKNHLLGGSRAQRTVDFTNITGNISAAIVDFIGKEAAHLVKVELCKDGSGIGGTLLAAGAVEQKKQAQALAEIPSAETRLG